jgi:hypothetical protein
MVFSKRGTFQRKPSSSEREQAHDCGFKQSAKFVSAMFPTFRHRPSIGSWQTRPFISFTDFKLHNDIIDISDANTKPFMDWCPPWELD